jgi:hypothetical protein
MNPGDTLEGRGLLLQHGRLVASVDYHLTIPRETHFMINPTGSFNFDYEEYLGGFILLSPDEAQKISLTEYTLELVNKSKKTIRVERRYKKIEHKGQPRISFWVKVI